MTLLASGASLAIPLHFQSFERHAPFFFSVSAAQSTNYPNQTRSTGGRGPVVALSMSQLVELSHDPPS